MALTNEEAIGGLEIVAVEAWSNEMCPNGAIRIHWVGDIGFGQYDIMVGEDGKLRGYSERMESNEDKYFSKELLRLLHEKIVVEE